MEEKQRVKDGEAYYPIFLFGSGYSIIEMTKGSGYLPNFDKQCFEFNNYFSTKESAEQMLRKLRAVLAGADVIDVATANVGSADELEAKKHQIELILSHRQTIVIAEHKGSLDWRWNTKSIETRNDMLKTVIRINFTKEEEDLPRYVNYLLAEAKHTTK